MRRVLEAIFRHDTELLLMMLVPVVIAFLVAYVQPRKYEASATLWALQRYSVIGATGPEADLTSTPASTQATALAELMQTRTFALAVANDTDLPSTAPAAIRANPNALDDALVGAVSSVTVTAVGANLFQITYDNTDPKIAKQVVAAVITQFGAVASQFSAVEGEQLLTTYSGQLAQAQAVLNTASSAESRYLGEHPGVTAQSDAAYSQLVNQAQADQAAVFTLQTNINQIKQQLAQVGNGSKGMYLIIDAAAVADRPVSRTKTLAMGGAIGLAVALLACSVYLVLLLRQDRSTYTTSEMQRITDLPVLLELPYVPTALTSKAVNARLQKGRGRRLLR